MKVLSEIPHALKGRGQSACFPIECQCGEAFLFPAGKGLTMQCPTCKTIETFTEAELVPHDGQHI